MDVASVEIDCRGLVESLKYKKDFSWETRASSTKCLQLLQQLPNVDMLYCPQAANTVADWAVRQQRNKNLPCNWMVSPPQGLWALLCNDALTVGWVQL